MNKKQVLSALSSVISDIEDAKRDISYISGHYTDTREASAQRTLSDATSKLKHLIRALEDLL